MDGSQAASPAGLEGVDGGGEGGRAASVSVVQPWDDDLPFRRDDFVRVISSCLKGLGYENASRALEEESGHKAEPDECTARLLWCVSNGCWKEALDLLSHVEFVKPVLHAQARALLLRHRLVELVEDRHVDEALSCLREDLAPLFTRRDKDGEGEDANATANATATDDGSSDSFRPEQLHALSTLLLAPTAASLRRLSAPGKPWVSASRLAARSDATAALRRLLVEGGRAIRHGRLEHLVAQAVTLQRMNCMYHNNPQRKVDLAADHSCDLDMLPQVSTHVLEDHADEVWCCRFSNGGGMLATSSADGVLIVWDVGNGSVGGGTSSSDPQSAPIVHKRIQVRDAAPEVIAWSPDDRWLLTCGGSSEVTRWDVATGKEARCYGGEHTEAVTGVAWLRDSRGFVSAGQDRKVIVWSLGGIVLSCWNCNTRIFGIVATPPPQPPAPRLPPAPLFEEASSARSSRGADQNWSNEYWPLQAAGAERARNSGGMVSNGRGGEGHRHASPPPRPLHRRPSGGKRQQREEEEQEQQQRRRERSARNLRRCRVWAICRQDTIQAIDIEVVDYGEPPPPPPPLPDGYGNGVNGAERNGSQNGIGGTSSSSGSRGSAEEVDVKLEGEEGGTADGRRYDGGFVGLGGGGGQSPRFTPRSKSGGSCSIEEGPHQYFDGDLITGVSAPGDGSHHLLLHLDRARIRSWNSKTRRTLEIYEGHHQSLHIVHSTFGGLNDSFVASGSEDSLVYLWHRSRGELIGSLAGHAATVNAVHWNPARPGMLASVSDDQTVRIWEAPAVPQQAPLPLSPHSGDGDAFVTAAAATAAAGGVAAGSLGRSGGGGGAGKGDRFGGGGGGGGSGSGSGSPSPRNRNRGQKQANVGSTAGRVRVKTELGATNTEPGNGSGGKGKGKGKGQSGRRPDGGPGVKLEGGWGGGRWGYGLPRAPSAAGQGWKGWGAEGGGWEGQNDGGFSARIAALRW